MSDTRGVRLMTLSWQSWSVVVVVLALVIVAGMLGVLWQGGQ